MVRDPRLPEPLSWDTFMVGLWRENPPFVMLLGLCPGLAVTHTPLNAPPMGLATALVPLFSGVLLSLLRDFIPTHARLPPYFIIIST
ncbi:MAG: Rnf-Nqr domain containing protein, partial [Puniceicoccaceae bacterium]